MLMRKNVNNDVSKDSPIDNEEEASKLLSHSAPLLRKLIVSGPRHVAHLHMILAIGLLLINKL